jgi:hypothetical protein
MLLGQMRPVVCLIHSGPGQGADERLYGWGLRYDTRGRLVGRGFQAAEEIGHQLGDRLARAPSVRLSSADQALFEAESQFGLHKTSDVYGMIVIYVRQEWQPTWSWAL